MDTTPTTTTTTSTPPHTIPPTKRKHNKNTANTNAQTQPTQPNEHTDTTNNPIPTQVNYIAVRTTNTALMSYIQQNEDIRAVTDPKTQKGHTISTPQGILLVGAPSAKATYLAKTFPEDAGTPRAELANKLITDVKKKTPPPGNIATDPDAAKSAPERSRRDHSR
jgi:hypothetical protein